MSNQSKGRHEEATWLGAINQHKNKLIVEAPKSGKEFIGLISFILFLMSGVVVGWVFGDTVIRFIVSMLK